MLTDHLAYVFLAIAGAWILIRSVAAWQRAGRAALYCPRCGTVAKSKQLTPGSGGIEIVLWLCFILPGLIYSLWRASSKFETCPACGEAGMIPLASPKAQAGLKIRGV
jgi:predicted RNA-binding Zn-ribbon protein involved in translation (DUF1610 family)